MSNADRPPRGLRPVTRVELPAYNKWLRFGAIILCLVVAAIALTAGLTDLLNKDNGWKTIEVNSTNLNCSRDFVLNYYLGDAGVSATAEYKQLEALYTEATETAYRIFQDDVPGENRDIAYLSTHVNEPVTVDPVLYEALSMLCSYENRNVYMAPVYVEYSRIFRSETEPEAASFDPEQSEEAAAYIRQITAFTSQPEHIQLELLGSNQVRLKVSQEYLAFAQANEITEFLRLGWMKNAFIADYLAQRLADAGYTNGYLVSYDGFTRNLDARGLQYSFNLFDRIGNAIDIPAVMYYQDPASIVFLRNYPLYPEDADRYYAFSDGRVVSAYLDPRDGLCRSSTDTLVSYSKSAGCARILLELLPIYLADSLSVPAVNALTEQEIYSIWFADTVLNYNDPAFRAELSAEATGYTMAFAG